ncbi:hypothetical protein ACFXPS_22180 [Nocardia sp. NPDC059091]|uniref:hypothetical protein n=1 Tax=Nocardia sp. NPDC059091 TaxID=3346724 RepID=UPI00369DA449
MRALWFIPHGNRWIAPESETRYPGGWVSTAHALRPRAARAVAARGRQRARLVLSLLEGLGFAIEGGREAWVPGAAVGEGLNPLDRGPSNGRYHSVGMWGRHTDPAITADDIRESLKAMPPGSLPHAWVHHLGHLRLTTNPETGFLAVDVVVESPTYFYQWSGRRALEPLDKQQTRDERVLGFTARAWEPHAPIPDGMSKHEAVQRVRLFLLGAQGDIDRTRFDADRFDDGWLVSMSGRSNVNGLTDIRVDDCGVIKSGE